MFHLSHPEPAPSAAAGGAREAIARCVRAFVAPPPALYCECNQERLRQHSGQLAVLDARLEDLRREAFAAATRLMSLAPDGERGL